MIWIILISLIVMAIVYRIAYVHGKRVEAKKISHVIDLDNELQRGGTTIKASVISEIIYDNANCPYMDGVHIAAEIIAGLFEKQLEKSKTAVQL